MSFWAYRGIRISVRICEQQILWDFLRASIRGKPCSLTIVLILETCMLYKVACTLNYLNCQRIRDYTLLSKLVWLFSDICCNNAQSIYQHKQHSQHRGSGSRSTIPPACLFIFSTMPPTGHLTVRLLVYIVYWEHLSALHMFPTCP